MPTTVIAMKSAELVKAISCPPMWPSVKNFLISNWWIGSAIAGSFLQSYRILIAIVSRSAATRRPPASR